MLSALRSCIHLGATRCIAAGPIAVQLSSRKERPIDFRAEDLLCNTGLKAWVACLFFEQGEWPGLGHSHGQERTDQRPPERLVAAVKAQSA